MSKYTAGPWVHSAFDIIGNTHDGNGMVADVTCDGVPSDEAFANVRLIAAAPDLLEALELVSDAYGFDPSIDSAIWQTVRTAIAKATGETR